MAKHPGARMGSPKESGKMSMSGGHTGELGPVSGPGKFAMSVSPANRYTKTGLGNFKPAGMKTNRNGDDDNV